MAKISNWRTPSKSTPQKWKIRKVLTVKIGSSQIPKEKFQLKILNKYWKKYKSNIT
jgi:hypothetical protein